MGHDEFTPDQARRFIDEVKTSNAPLTSQIAKVYTTGAWVPLYGREAAGWEACCAAEFPHASLKNPFNAFACPPPTGRDA